MTAFFALAGALIVGASDFGGGLAARSTSPLRVTAWIQATGFVCLFVAVWFVDAPEITGRDLIAGAVAGLAGTVAFASLYSSFSSGQISRLAPVAAILGAAVPAVVSWFRGEAVTAVQLMGVVLALVAVALVTQERAREDVPPTTPPKAFALAVLAGVAFSVFFLALAETQDDAGLWPLIAVRVISVPLAIAAALVFSKGIRMPSTGAAGLTTSAGVAEALASVFVLLAYQRGPVAVAAVLGAFYPLSTVALARIVLDERLQRIQWFGVVLALLSIPLIALPHV